ncbi:hypothetical protein [Robiginitomaculum antarcticum]|uniref:hypothetical protein n=1 Tax=Robiginitomaculum antarcticum TaxID=437507 RepID=UPI000368F0C9|nr:hypothetical protein [Robiginitomaculum antarcticum]
MELITDWTEQNQLDYGKEVMSVGHKLNATGLFTDDALAAMLDLHPNHLIDVLAVPNNHEYQEYRDQQLTVDFRGADGKTLIAAAKAGDIWINVREVMNRQPAYKTVLDQLHAELEDKAGKNKDRRNCRGGILISSPTARTPYHSDPTMTHLWHIRGHKRAYVYPMTQVFLPDSAFEAIVLGEMAEDVPYKPEFDDSAIVADLMGGEMISWPHRSPHRVENVSFCVSMVMEFSTQESAFINAGMMTNGILRRRYGRTPSWEHASQIERVFKSMIGRVLRKLGAQNAYKRTDLVKFKLDPSAKGFLKMVATPYQRAF